METNEKKYIFTRHIFQNRIPFLVSAIFSFVMVFSLFLPVVITRVASKETLVLFYQSFAYMEDRQDQELFLSILFLTFGYIFSLLSLPLGISSLFVNQKMVRRQFLGMLGLTIITFACYLVGLIEMKQCKNLSILIGPGLYILIAISIVNLTSFFVLYLLLKNSDKRL